MLHVVGLTQNGNIYHSTRNSLSHNWTQWEDVTSKVGNPSSPFHTISCATVGFDLHICGRTADGKILHTFRNRSKNWQKTWGDVGSIGGREYNFPFAVGLAGLIDGLHVIAPGMVISGGRRHSANRFPIQHAIRSSSPPSWPQHWQQIDGGLANSASITDVGCASVNGQLHVCALSNGELLHTIRLSSAPNDWQQYNDVRNHSTISGSINSIAVAGIGNRLHVCTQVDGDLYHTIRTPNRWQDSFGNVTGVMGNAFSGELTNIACANVDDNLHICCVTRQGQIIHTIRITKSESWQNPEGSGNAVFGDVTAVVGTLGSNPGSFVDVGIAGPWAP